LPVITNDTAAHSVASTTYSQVQLVVHTRRADSIMPLALGAARSLPRSCSAARSIGVANNSRCESIQCLLLLPAHEGAASPTACAGAQSCVSGRRADCSANGTRATTRTPASCTRLRPRSGRSYRRAKYADHTQRCRRHGNMRRTTHAHADNATGRAAWRGSHTAPDDPMPTRRQRSIGQHVVRLRSDCVRGVAL
jgi:hypothetical protein